MVCQKCGGEGFTSQRRAEEMERRRKEHYEKLKDKPCDELLDLRTDTYDVSQLEAITRILRERGH